MDLESDNKMLVDNYNDVQMKLSLLNSNINILENEKDRHLEQNAVDKQNLEEQIENLIKMSEEDKKRMIGISNENNSLRNEIGKVQ
jgi:hypothetical protein